MKQRIAIQKLIIPVSWVVVTFLVSFILAKHIYPEVETEEKLFGLRTIYHYSFNYTLFYISLSISLSVLLVGELLRMVSSIRTLTNRIVSSVFVSPWFILVLTLSSGCFYMLGLTKPLFLSEQFFFIEKEVTLLNSIRMMFQNDEMFLGTTILTFTLVFPIFKYLLLLFSMLLKQKDQLLRLNRWISVVSKWSMLDVYIIALLLLNMKFDSRIVNMELKEGVVWFSLSIILIMLAMVIQGFRARSN
ncbi:MAG: paraquat-inducible protein A [Bacteroidales bacterium]|nr:paraquat-inducible protein A [Bacteroidales bacterium]